MQLSNRILTCNIARLLGHIIPRDKQTELRLREFEWLIYENEKYNWIYRVAQDLLIGGHSKNGKR